MLSIVPPLITNVLVALPSAVALLIFSRPVFSVTPPVKVFATESVSAPVPFLVRAVVAVLLLMAPPSAVLPVPSMVRITGTVVELFVMVPLMVSVFEELLIQV